MAKGIWNREDLQSASREIFDEPKRCDYTALEAFGLYVAIDESGHLRWVPMELDGSPEIDRGMVAWNDLTAPDQELLDVVNRDFGRDFKLEQFAGR